jgi:hypothetical protein
LLDFLLHPEHGYDMLLRSIRCLLPNYTASISVEVMLPSACSFIVDGRTFSCRCSTLHVSAYIVIFRCVYDVSLFIPEGICFAAFVALSCTWLYYTMHVQQRQQKQRSRFLQEYKSETSYTPEDGNVGRNM